jgi:hypothetical protein
MDVRLFSDDHKKIPDAVPLLPDGRPRPGSYEEVHFGIVRWQCKIGHDKRLPHKWIQGERLRLTWVGWLLVAILVTNLAWALIQNCGLPEL